MEILIGVRAVKSRLHRARVSVRRQLEPFLQSAEAAERGSIREETERCPDTVRFFSRHLEGELRPADCRKMERHLAGCERCQAACQSLKRTLTLCAESSTTELPRVTQDAVDKALRAYLASVGRKSPAG